MGGKLGLVRLGSLLSGVHLLLPVGHGLAVGRQALDVPVKWREDSYISTFHKNTTKDNCTLCRPQNARAFVAWAEQCERSVPLACWWQGHEMLKLSLISLRSEKRRRQKKMGDIKWNLRGRLTGWRLPCGICGGCCGLAVPMSAAATEAVEAAGTYWARTVSCLLLQNPKKMQRKEDNDHAQNPTQDTTCK